MSNILNHNRPIFELNVSKSDYWDTHIYLKQGGDGLYDNALQEDCLSAYIDTTFPECREEDNELVSKQEYTWVNAINNGINLDNIGLTGVDNGIVTFDKDTINEEDFVKKYTETTLEIDENDLRLHVNKVDGNNKIYSYPLHLVADNGMVVSKLEGGFYQGFFQINNGCNYKVLPTSIENGWTLEFTLKPEKYKSDYSIIRQKYSDNEYNSDGWDAEKVIEKYSNIVYNNDGWDGLLPKNAEYSNDYFSDDYANNNPLPTLNDVYKDNNGIFFYIGTRSENKWWKYYVDSDDTTQVETADGTSLNEQISEISTDNKFITYNRTFDGYKAFMGHIDDEQVLKMQKQLSTENYFIIMHRGKDGYTARSIKQLQQESNADYDILADLYRNAMAFQIKENGSIGYKFMVKDCDNESGYSIDEEWSNPNTVKYDEWTTIDVRIFPTSKYTSVENAKMRMMFYVNGRLVLYTRELPMLALRALADSYSKQEGVPYNISIGGGTQGLCDVIYEDYKNLPQYVLFLEREFGGSFLGCFKSFKFYTCDKNYNEINSNVEFEREQINYLYKK